MKTKSKLLAGVAILVLAPALAIAAPLSIAPPAVKTVPVFEVTPPNQLPPANELPNAPFAVGLYSAILAQANNSNELPTSPKPPLPNVTGYYLNTYKWHWPTVPESQAWWSSQPGAPGSGTEAYKIGIVISHQQQQGWFLTSGAVADPQPYCSTGAGYTNNQSWGGQFVGWTGSCTYTPPPSCPTSAGWTGSYSWNGSSWVSGCQYASQPSCPTSAGWTGSYYWNGSSWVSGCRYQSQPSCPAGYGGSYSWNGSGWVSGCTPPAPPPSNGGGDNPGGGSGGSGGSEWVAYAPGGSEDVQTQITNSYPVAVVVSQNDAESLNALTPGSATLMTSAQLAAASQTLAGQYSAYGVPYPGVEYCQYSAPGASIAYAAPVLYNCGLQVYDPGQAPGGPGQNG